MWDKFVFLSTLAGMTCMMRATVGTIVSTPAGEHLVTRLLDECIAVADASGHRPSDAQLATYRSQLTQRKSASKASMLRDIERGSRTEGEHILGDMHARAKSLSVDTPLLEVALTHLRAYEASRTSA
jgi:2-dehydropantoate 2-reductase